MAYDAAKEDAKKAKQNKKAQEQANKQKANEAKKQAKEKVDAAEKKLKALEKEKSNLEKIKKDIEKDLQKAQKQIQADRQAADDARAKFENIQAHLAAGDGLYTQADMEAALRELEAAQNKVNQSESQLATLNAQLDNIEDKIADKEYEISDAEIELSEAERRYDDVKDAISNGDIDEASELAKEGDDDVNSEDEEDEDDGSDNENENLSVDEMNPQQASTQRPPIAPWDTRLYRNDAFVNGNTRIPLSSEEGASMLADMIGFNMNEKKHGVPNDSKQYGILANDPNVYGLLSLINPYSVTRLYNSLKGLSFDQDKYISFSENRMLDIRDQKRFYDTKVVKGDVLSVSNPTTTNIIELMNNDRWGRTPYTYQDFVFCKYFNRIPNNRLITLRKYHAPTYDNLCWELMGEDKDLSSTSFAPIATACTYFGGESGNNLKDLFSIESGLNWEELQAQIWDVTGDAGETQQQVADRIIDNGGTNSMDSTKANFINSMFRGGGKQLGNALSMLKFIGVTGNPNVFDPGAANADKFYQNLHDPNDNGPYHNRIKGPLNRIDKVMKRKEGLKFSHKITLKFAYEARPIGGVNTKAVMMEIISNMLLLCSASAVFWGGGHRFMIQPHAYPWNNLDQNTRGFLKSVYNGQFFGKKGAIAQALQGIVAVGHGSGSGGGFNFENIIDTMKALGAGVMGVLGGALNTLVGSISGSLGDIGQYLEKGNEWVQGQLQGNTAAVKGATAFTNLMKNTQNIWKANSVKQTILPSVSGLRSLLLGTPVGNWHLTVGNPLNPIAVIGNLICQDIKFEFGEELGPDDFPTNLTCIVTLEHGMPRDLEAIESMFNRGAGRIYHAPDYIKLWGSIPSSEQETKVDAMTGGTAVRVPHAFMSVEGQASAGKYYSRNIANTNSDTAPKISSRNQILASQMTNLNANKVVDYNRGGVDENGRTIVYTRRTKINERQVIKGNLSTRHYVDG